MKKIFYILLSFSVLGMAGCEKQEKYIDATPSQVPISILATIDNSVEGRAYGGTGYQATSFASDNIGVFATRTRSDANPPTRSDIFANFGNIGYVVNGTNRASVANGNQLAICAPIFPSIHLDMYAYYPWPDINKISSVINIDDLSNIKFRLYQDQTQANLNICNIMRAEPIKDRSYSTTVAASRIINFNFKHIMTLIEFHLYKASDAEGGGWLSGDVLNLDRVIVLGAKVSTEGTFDLVGATPNVQITNNPNTSSNSMYKNDGALTPINPLDAYTGPTKGVRRHVILPPVPTIGDPAPGVQGDVEFIISLRWTPQGSSEVMYTNRHYIVRNMSFESGKKYIFNVALKRYDPPQTKINITGTAAAWEGNYNWGTTFE